MIILRIVQVFITWLLIASLIALLTKKLRVPYTVGLVLAGLVLAIITPLIRQQPEAVSAEQIRSVLIPELILFMLLPPLVFEAAFHVRWGDLRASIKPIMAFAIPGVILTMLVVGLVIHWGAGVALPAALVFGALISATDPIAVVALFHSLGAPKQLLVLLEGESLFNDSTAIVLFHTMLGIVATSQFRPLASILDFLLVAIGGLLIGGAIGLLATFALKRVTDHLVEIALSLVTAYGAYLLAERLEVSGVLAVLVAGLVSGNVRAKEMPESSKSRMLDFWEFAAFLANSFIFLLIGLTTKLDLLLDNISYVALAILAVLLSRAVVIYGFSRFSKNIPPAFQHVLFWGGLRGAVSLALALSLTSAELGANLEVLQAMAFGVVLFTVLAQGTSMAAIVKRLNLKHPPLQDTT